jgi:hypothetical protein
MSATSNSRPVRRLRLRRGLALGLAAAVLAISPAVSQAGYTNRADETAAAITAAELARLALRFDEAKSRLAANPTNTEAAWQFGRACFELADLATNSTRRAEIARQGIEASRQLIRRESGRAAAHYYLGLNLGELARTETFRALKLVKEMETAFKRAIELDPRFDFAGAHRAVGLLYQDTPGWPISLGSRKHAREHLSQAAQLAPEFPENQLCLIEALLEWGERKAADVQLQTASALLAKARTQFAGAQWAASWQDWDARFAKLQAALGQKIEPARSPRDH